jgi:hypothetical protein
MMEPRSILHLDPPKPAMLFAAAQDTPTTRLFVLDCPHINWQIDREYTDDSHDAEVLGTMMIQVRKIMAEAVMSGKTEEMCTCEPKGWRHD